MSNATLRDIADAAGVSHAAVSRVINGRPAGIRVSAATRERIMAIVRQTGYQPNRIARDMALGRKTTLGLVLAPDGPDASAAHLPAIDALLAAAGYRLLLIVLPADPTVARMRVSALLHDGVAGLLAAPAAMSVAISVAAGKCPVVALEQGAGAAILQALGESVPATPAPLASAAPSPAIPKPAPVLSSVGSSVEERWAPCRPVVSQQTVPRGTVPNTGPLSRSGIGDDSGATTESASQSAPTTAPEPAVTEPISVMPEPQPEPAVPDRLEGVASGLRSRSDDGGVGSSTPGSSAVSEPPSPPIPDPTPADVNAATAGRAPDPDPMGEPSPSESTSEPVSPPPTVPEPAPVVSEPAPPEPPLVMTEPLVKPDPPIDVTVPEPVVVPEPVAPQVPVPEPVPEPATPESAPEPLVHADAITAEPAAAMPEPEPECDAESAPTASSAPSASAL